MKFIFRIIFNIITILIFIFTLTFSIIGGVTFHKAHNAFLPLITGYEPISIYDDTNNLVASTSMYYKYVPLNEISNNIINAFISIEDKNFYNHNGYDLKRIIGATITNIKEKNITSGASTITQQYVKNVFLTNKKTFKRKAYEIAYAIQIEKKYSKDQILEAYLNSILFGGNIYGIEMASNYYFNLPSNNLTISMAAYLAGLIQAPNRYNAYNNKELANRRKNVVLKEMLKEGYINQEEYKNELNVKIEDLLSKGVNDDNSYLNHYFDYVYNNLDNTYNIKNIKTYLNKDMQIYLEKLVSSNYGLFNDDNLNCSIVVLDNYTSGIKALISNRVMNHNIIDYATKVKLQPGSTIKPILDYGPALEYLGYSPSTILYDDKYYYSTGQEVRNYDHINKGAITLRYALKDSRNVPAVKLFKSVGDDNAIKFASKLGLNIDKLYEADAIGGATNGYTLLELASAYETFANLGYYKKASAIKEILTITNEKIENSNKKSLVIKPTTCWLINNILHGVFEGSSYDLSNTYLMAKTGQTNYDTSTIKKYNIPENATKDSLLIAYTKDLTLAIWVGYNNISSNNYLDRYKKNIPRAIMKKFLEKYAENNNYYPMIKGIVKKQIEIYNDTSYLSDNGFYEYFEEGKEPFSYAKKVDKI